MFMVTAFRTFDFTFHILCSHILVSLECHLKIILNTEQCFANKMPINYFGNITKFIYLGTSVANQNYIPRKIKRKLESGNVTRHSLKKLVFSVSQPTM